MGFEASGTVLATGPGVEGIHVGDAIGVLPGFDTSKYGTYADHAIIPQDYVLPQPPGLTNIQAAGLWMAYLTAYGGLIEAGCVASGDRKGVVSGKSVSGRVDIGVRRNIKNKRYKINNE